MIYLTEIIDKLNTVLNSSSYEGFNNPTDFLYRVESVGFHLDYNYDNKSGKNFIPVFISTLGGSINPVPNLKQVNINVPITFYFPVRFKDEMFLVFDYLVNVFSGKIHYYEGKRALSNLSVPNYGEIQNLDLKQFKEWVDQYYRMPIEIMEPYLSMSFTLYIQTSDENYLYGNEVKISRVKFTNLETGVVVVDDTNPTFIEYVDMENSEPASQQLFSDTHAKGFPANAAYTKQMPLILKRTTEYYNLLQILEVSKNPQRLKVEITEEIPFENNQKLQVTNGYFITNYNRKTSKGELVGLQFTLSPLGELGAE